MTVYVKNYQCKLWLEIGQLCVSAERALCVNSGPSFIYSKDHAFL